MHKKAWLALYFIVGAIVICVAVLWFSASRSENTSPDLNNSDIASLVTFLQQSNLQAAVVQKFYQPNNASTWLVKSDGQTIFLYSKNLGTIYDYGVRLNYDMDIQGPYAAGPELLPGFAIVRDDNSETNYNISQYLAVASSSAFIPTALLIPSVPISYFLSPNERYSMTGSLASGTTLSSVQMQSDTIVNTPIAQIPYPTQFINWSVDGNYMLFKKDQASPEGLEIYNIRNATTTYIDGTIGSEAQDLIKPFPYYIYPSTVIFGWMNPDGVEATYALNFANNNQTTTEILPEQIKLVGFIPNPVPFTVTAQ
jgi:hypothetical protein